MSTNLTCERRIQFCAGHRVMGHENKCAHLHGHNYVVHVVAEKYVGDINDPTEQLDAIGRVVDFSVLKEKIGGWIEENWDHGFIGFDEDHCAWKAIHVFSSEMNTSEHWQKGGGFYQKRFGLPYNPTAENMARYLLEAVGPTMLRGLGVRLIEVRVHETENCVGIARLE